MNTFCSFCDMYGQVSTDTGGSKPAPIPSLNIVLQFLSREQSGLQNPLVLNSTLQSLRRGRPILQKPQGLRSSLQPLRGGRCGLQKPQGLTNSLQPLRSGRPILQSLRKEHSHLILLLYTEPTGLLLLQRLRRVLPMVTTHFL